MNNFKIYFIILIFFILSCQKRVIEENGYIKDKESIFKIDYDKIIKKENKEESILLATIDKINTFNPYRANSKIEFFLKNGLYTTLFYIDPTNGEIKNNIIESYSINNNGLEIKFRLKENTGLKTDDIIATLLLLNTFLRNTPYYKEFFIKNTKLQPEKVDDFEFKITLDYPNSNILYAMADYPILLKDDINNIKDFQDFILKWRSFNNLPLPTGPYKIRYIDDKNLILTKNENYFKKDKPQTKEIHIKFYQSLNDMVLSFISGDIDIIEFTNNEDFDNLYNYVTKNKVKDILFIDTNETYKKNFILWNNNESIREYINSFIVLNLNKKYNVYSNIKKFDSNKKPIFNKNLRLLCLEDNSIQKEIFDNIVSILKNNSFDITTDYVPFYKYLENVFFKENCFDLTLISYDFKLSLYSYYSFFFDSNYGLNKFYKEDIINEEFNYLLKEYDTKKHEKRVSKIFEILEKNNKLNVVFQFKKYYAIRSHIYNFKINSMYEDNFNLITLENIFKINK